ncbi:hypothetical protein CMK11_11660 [Candidatus Poribacteria bacterium]|nr:hypothetical protein [Candidatus Poribacteria bacterium]
MPRPPGVEPCRSRVGDRLPTQSRRDWPMANQEHLGILRQGVDTWNAWRRGGTGTQPDLAGANLRRADLDHADLTRAYLIGARLREANLRGGRLSRADLRGAVLRGADLRQADLRGADLSGAHVNRADLRGADLSGANMARAVYSAETAFPPSFDPAAHDMRLWH